MASFRKIAKQTGLSIATVSRVLNNRPDVSPETRARVVSALDRDGADVGAIRRPGQAMGYVLASESHICDYDAAILEGASRALDEFKLDLSIVNVVRDKLPRETFAQFFQRKGLACGLVRTSPRHGHLCEAMAEEGLPTIVIAQRFENPKVSFIRFDSTDDSRRAVQHLLDLGHRRIALVTHSVMDEDHLDRETGYRQAMRDARIEIEPELVVPVLTSPVSGAVALNRLMSLPVPPTAVYVADPKTTLGLLRRAQEMKLHIPEDLSVIGFDDRDFRQIVFPPFTAVCQNAVSLGYEAAVVLGQIVRNGSTTSEPVRRTASTTFEIQNTTGRPPIEQFRILPDGSRAPVLAAQSA